GRMVLFLKRRGDAQQGGQAWGPAGGYFRTSVAWLKDGRVLAVQQTYSKGPAYVTDVGYVKSEAALKEMVAMFLESDRLLSEARQAESTERTMTICMQIINGEYVNKDEALDEMGKCGPQAVKPLKEYVIGEPMSHQRTRAIAALADAGGQSVLPYLHGMLKEELKYWKSTAPTLKKRWWSDTNCEAWIRRGRVAQIARAFRRYPYPPAIGTLVALRDVFRATPVIEQADGIGKISDRIDETLLAQIEQEGTEKGVSLSISLESRIENDMPVISPTLIIKNAGPWEATAQHPSNRGATAFVVFDSDFHHIAAKRVAKVQAGTQTVKVKPGGIYAQRFHNLSFVDGAGLCVFDLERGKTYRVLAIYRPDGKWGPGIATTEKLIEVK
ncbi:MAG: hypothetical protein ACYSX1_11230, partial [Planctomycetota bacterium]